MNLTPLRLLIFAFLVSFAFPACGQTASKQMVVLVVPGLRADDLAQPELPTLRELVKQGAIGWMNTRTARVSGASGVHEPEEAAYLTLGAGSRATAGPYARFVDVSSFRRLREENGRLDHPVEIGALGRLLHSAGLKTAVSGNEDDSDPRRAAKLIAIDENGGIDTDSTEIEPWNRYHPLEPYGIAFDNSDFRLPADPTGFVEWIFGDVARADRYAPLCLPEAAFKHRSSALKRLDALLAQNVLPLASSPGCRVILISPGPADTAASNDRLSPILMLGEGVRPGLLTSGSTHVKGLVTNTDFLPTVAEFFGLKPPAGSVGRPMTVANPSKFSTEAANTPESWAALHDHWVERSAQQGALGGLPTLQAILVVFATVLIGSKFAVEGRTGKLVGFFQRLPLACALAILALPVLEFLLPLASVSDVWQAEALFAISTLIIGLVGARKPALARTVGVALMAVLTVCVAFDQVVGGALLRGSWFSYSLMEGARYYGIGNEYAGAILGGSFSLMVLLYWGKKGVNGLKWLPGLVLLALVVGLPFLGANAGALLGMLVGYGAAALVWWRGRLRARELFGVLLLAAIVLGATLVIDLSRSGGSQTHIARAMLSGGSIFSIVVRKAALNAYLLTHSPWSLALFASLGGLWVLWRSPSSRLRAEVTENRLIHGCMVGLLVGAVGIIVFNDSGVVAGTETLLLAWAAVLVATRNPQAEVRDL